MGLNHPGNMKLYTFVDNHDVERIYTRLNVKAHFTPVHILLYTLPGIPSIYYGSEFGIEGRKENWSDDSLRPALNLDNYKDALTANSGTRLISALGRIRQNSPALKDGDYQEMQLTTRQYVFSRNGGGQTLITAVNNDDALADIRIPWDDQVTFTGLLTGQKVTTSDHALTFTLPGNSGEIWALGDAASLLNDPLLKKIAKTSVKKAKAEKPAAAPVKEPEAEKPAAAPVKEPEVQKPAAPEKEAVKEKEPVPVPRNKSYEEMTVEELQSAILEKLAKLGPVTDQMRRDVAENVWHDSLVNWVRSFN